MLTTVIEFILLLTIALGFGVLFFLMFADTIRNTPSKSLTKKPPFKVDIPMYKSTTITYMEKPNEKTKPAKKTYKSTNKAIKRTK